MFIYRAFWESMDEPSLDKFLNFRIRAEDLKDETTEHNRELNSISKHYPEISEIGKKVKNKARFQDYFADCVERLRACNDKNSNQINKFWDLQTKGQNIIMEIKLLEEKNKLVEKELECHINLEQTQQILDENRSQASLLQQAVTRKIEKRILDETQVSYFGFPESEAEQVDVENEEEIKDLTEEETDIRNKLLAVLTAQRRRDTQSKKDCLSSICLNGILDFSNDKINLPRMYVTVPTILTRKSFVPENLFNSYHHEAHDIAWQLLTHFSVRLEAPIRNAPRCNRRRLD
ncbi:unnamed protein product [Rhizophagus irregularis]|nr:unnamed protein product [Rhizophagus irregularis]